MVLIGQETGASSSISNIHHTCIITEGLMDKRDSLTDKRQSRCREGQTGRRGKGSGTQTRGINERRVPADRGERESQTGSR